MRVIPGMKFGRWVVLADLGRVSGRLRARCRCECGKVTDVLLWSLWDGSSRSCGCLMRDLLKRRLTTHGENGLRTPEYTCWAQAKSRCNNPNNPAYRNYGGRGIRMSDEWSDSFPAFLEDMGRRPSAAHTIGRINNDLGYCKENCRWETRQEQAYNKRTTRLVSFNGSTKPLKHWARDLGVNYAALCSRVYNLGWSIEEALTTPVCSRTHAS